MAATMYYDADADLSQLTGKTVAIIGHGSQGHAHARNLAESGVAVVVGLYEGSKSRAAAEEAGLEVASVADAAKRADVVMILLPDQTKAAVYSEEIAPACRPATRCSSPTASTSTSPRSSRPRTSTSAWSRPRAPATWSAASTPRAAACPASSRSTRTPPAARATWRWPTPRASAAPAPASSRPPLRRRPRPTCSASRRSCAAAPQRWCRPASRCSSRPATSPRSPTSSASTS